MVEGYSDQKIQQIYQKPLYLGGDISLKPVLNLGRYPETSYVTLLTGGSGDDFDKVRTVYRFTYNNSKIENARTITVPKREWLGPSTSTEVQKSPFG